MAKFSWKHVQGRSDRSDRCRDGVLAVPVWANLDGFRWYIYYSGMWIGMPCTPCTSVGLRNPLVRNHRGRTKLFNIPFSGGFCICVNFQVKYLMYLLKHKSVGVEVSCFCTNKHRKARLQTLVLDIEGATRSDLIRIFDFLLSSYCWPTSRFLILTAEISC